MRALLVALAIALPVCAAFADNPVGDATPMVTLEAGGQSYDVSLLTSSGDIRVLYLQARAGAEQDSWTVTNYLLIQGGDNAFIQPLNGSLVGSRTLSVDRVNAAVVDLGKEPGVIATIAGGENPNVEYTVVRVYGVSADSVHALGDVQYLSNRELNTTVSAVRVTGRDWCKVRIAQSGDTGPAVPSVFQRVFYFTCNPSDRSYRPDDYTSQFSRQMAVQQDTYTPTVFIYYQLNDDGVLLRDQPSEQADVTATLDQDATFEILDRTDERQTIGGVTERWYKVLLKDGQGEGWIFGGSIRRK